jgi:hypothetical protein
MSLVPGNIYEIQYVGGRVYDPDLYNAAGIYLGERLGFYCFARIIDTKETLCGYIYYIEKKFILKKSEKNYSNEIITKILDFYNSEFFKDPIIGIRVSPSVYFDLSETK